MNYKITNFYTDTGSVLVKFYTDEFPEGLNYSVNIPIENGQYVSNEILETHIMSFAPYGQIQQILDLRNIPPPAITIDPIVAGNGEQTVEQTIAGIMAYVQTHMDSTAQSYGYDDIKSAATYADEPAILKYQNEGQALRAWRSIVWDSCTTKLAEYQAGTITQPTAQEVVDGLPVFVMPA